MSQYDEKTATDANRSSEPVVDQKAAGKRQRTDSIVRRKASGEGASSDAAGAYASATSGGGTEVPHRAEMERGFGTDFSNVQAHTGKSTQMNSIGAEAATLGTDSRIAFGDASPSKQTVAHELAHVVQARNSGGRSGGVQARSAVSQPSDAAEVQAEAAATTVAAGGIVDSGSLRAFGSGIMRRDVNVTAGRGKTDTESTTRVEDQGNTFEDQLDVWTKLQAWKNNTSITFALKTSNTAYTSFTRAPTDTDALAFFYEASIGIRRKVYLNVDKILERICTRFSKAESARIMGLCDFPLEWKIRHWFNDVPVVGPPANRPLMLQFIRNSPLNQRLVVCRDEEVIDLLTPALGSDHPENVFGDAIKSQLYPDAATQATFDAAHPKFAAWRGGSDKLDAEARWAEIATDPVTVIARLKTENVTTGARNKWTSLVHWGPRGQTLTATMRANIDKAALTAAVSIGDRADLFEARFNHPFTDPGAAFDKVAAVWKQLAKLPPGIVTSEMTRGVALRTTTSAGEYMDMPWLGSFGTWWTGTTGSLKHTAHTVRHEVGHAADVQAGGFSNLSSKPPILWKRWMTPTPWLQQILNYMDASGGPEAAAWMAFMTAAYNTAAFVNPFGAYTNTPGPDTPLQKRQKLWGRVATRYNASNDVKSALRLLKRKGKHTASPNTIRKIIAHTRAETYPNSKPSYLRDHFFLKKYGEHYSYHKKGGNQVWARNGKRGLSSYTLCSPYEYYADMFAAYYATDKNRHKNVPAWTSTYFKALTDKYDQAAVDTAAGGVTDTTAMGNHNAPRDPSL
jgi:hypothetical protein